MQTLKKGSRGEDVKTLQRRLGITADGIFGDKTEAAVKSFQASHGLVADGMAGSKTWSKLGVQSAPKRAINEIIVHCTATPEGRDYTNAQIRQWHIARGFSDIGYHYVIGLDGEIRKGRDESVVGAHCTGHNQHSVGVCYVGGYAADGKTCKDTRTPQQKAALLKVLKELKSRYPLARIHSHRDFANKACPCFDATKEYSKL